MLLDDTDLVDVGREDVRTCQEHLALTVIDTVRAPLGAVHVPEGLFKGVCQGPTASGNVSPEDVGNVPWEAGEVLRDEQVE